MQFGDPGEARDIILCSRKVKSNHVPTKNVRRAESVTPNDFFTMKNCLYGLVWRRFKTHDTVAPRPPNHLAIGSVKFLAKNGVKSTPAAGCMDLCNIKFKNMLPMSMSPMYKPGTILRRCISIVRSGNQGAHRLALSPLLVPSYTILMS